MRKPIIFIFLVATLCIHALSSVADWKSFNTEDGLVSNYTMGISIDVEDNVWVSGLGEGISRYNKTDWETSSLMSASALTTGADGSLWAAGSIPVGSGPISLTREAAVSQYTDAGWRIFTKADGLPESENMRSIAIDKDGNVWVGDVNGNVSKYDGTSWVTFPIADGIIKGQVWAIAQDLEGDIWFGVFGTGVSRFDGYNWDIYTTANGLASKNVTSIAVDQEGIMWIATDNGGISRCEPDTLKWQTFDSSDGLATNGVATIAVDQDGALWCGTWNGGVSRFDGTNWQTFTTDDGLANNTILDIAFDKSNNVWFTTNGGGVSRYSLTWTEYPGINTAKEMRTWGNFGVSLVIDKQNNIWAGTVGNGISKFDGKNWVTYSMKDGLANDIIIAVDAAPDGHIWVGTLVGVSEFDGVRWRNYTSSDGLEENTVWQLAVDSRGFVWASVYDTTGVWLYDGVKWQNIAVDGKLPIVRGVTVDYAGNVWLATTSGVSQYDSVGWQTFVSPDNGLKSSLGTSIAVDKQGNVWMGSPGGGVIHFNGTDWMSFTKEDGLSSPNVWGVTIDPETGYVWAGTDAGADFYDGESWTALSTKDGLIDNIVKSMVFHPNGEIWFGTLSGVSRYRRESAPPATFIIKVIPEPDALGRIGVDNVFIQFIGGDLATPTESLVYSYRVDDEPWTKPSSETSVSIFGRGVGEHVFQVRAKDKNANVDATPATLAFTIATPDPTAAILHPANDQSVTGIINVIGVATDLDFSRYQVEYGVGSNPTAWIQLGNYSITPVDNDVLLVWNTTNFNGTYTLRLMVTDELGHTSSDTVTVRVVAAKKQINRQTGGSVTDAKDKVKLYVPPNALKEDVEITIRAVPSEETLGLNTAARTSRGIIYELGPVHVVFDKPVTVTFQYGDDKEKIKVEQNLAVFRRNESDGDWQFVGGTVDTGAITISDTRLGIYAVAEYTLPTTTGKPVISNLNCQPRVFSPKGSVYKRSVTISFYLDNSDDVTIRIYNAARRLERMLIDNHKMREGNNAIEWYGKDDDGQIVTSGIYLVTASTSEMTVVKTVVVLNK